MTMRPITSYSTPATAAASISWELAGVASPDEYFASLLTILGRLFPSAALSWGRTDLSNGRSEIHGTPAEAYRQQDSSQLVSMLADHPLLLSFSANAPRLPRRLSDVTSRSELSKTEAYEHVLRPLHAEHQMVIVTEQVATLTGSCWTFSRDVYDFDDDDVELATKLQPLLVSLAHAEAELLTSWSDAENNIYGLTAREIEVLALVAKGLTATAIANLLRVSGSTVRKHMEHSYRKLHCGDRLVAVERARSAGVIPAH